MMRIYFQLACVLAVFELLLCVPLFGSDRRDAEKPNVIFILADDSGSVSYTHLTLATNREV